MPYESRGHVYFTGDSFSLNDRLFQEMRIHLFFKRKQDPEWVRAYNGGITLNEKWRKKGWWLFLEHL